MHILFGPRQDLLSPDRGEGRGFRRIPRPRPILSQGITEQQLRNEGTYCIALQTAKSTFG